MPKTSLLPGAVCEQWVKCGKPRCRCTRGQLHGPYYYRFWRENGKLRKEYVRLQDVKRVERACKARQAKEKRERREKEAAMALLRELKAYLRNSGL